MGGIFDVSVPFLYTSAADEPLPWGFQHDLPKNYSMQASTWS